MELKKYKRKREIPIGWKEIKLGDVFRTSSGATPLTTELSYYEGGNIPWINSGELASPYIYSTSNYITQKGFDNSSTEIYPKGTILVAMYGATAGKASMLKITACTNQAICAILPNDDYCPEFIKYNIDTLYEHLVGLSSGSARDNLSQAGLKELKLVLPKTKKEQENLIAALSLLDSKIELNKQINDNLEAMAKQLYDYWFVQFDFPNEEGKPYKSSDGAMVWNEKLKREIPQGWSICNVKSLIEPIERGISYSSDDLLDPFATPMINLACFSKAGDYRLGEMKFFSGKVSNDKLISPMDMLIACTDMTQGADIIGRPILASDESDQYTFSTDLALITPKGKFKMYLYYTLRTPFYHKYIRPFASGTTVKHLNLIGVENYGLPVPPIEIQSKFEDLITPIKEKQSKNLNEINALTKQRNELLPLLMNGQATVNYHLSDD